MGQRKQSDLLRYIAQLVSETPAPTTMGALMGHRDESGRDLAGLRAIVDAGGPQTPVVSGPRPPSMSAGPRKPTLQPDGGEILGRAKTILDLLNATPLGLLGDVSAPLENMDAAGPVAGVKKGIKATNGVRLSEALAGDAAGVHSLNRPELIKAAEQGFDPRPMWHETHRENLPSLLDEGFDLSRGKARTSDEMMPDGVFLKPNWNPIGLTVEKKDAAQVPLVHRAQNTAVFNDRDQLKSFLVKDEQYRQLLQGVAEVDKHFMPRYDALEKIAWGHRSGESPEIDRARDQLDQLLEEWKDAGDRAATAARTRATQVFREKGHDSVRVGNDQGSFGRSVDTTVILDPEKVRSIYAAFDPDKKDSKELLASLAAITSGTALAEAQRRKQK